MPKLTGPVVDAAATEALVQCTNSAICTLDECPPSLAPELIDRVAVLFTLDVRNTLINKSNQVCPMGMCVLTRGGARVLPTGDLPETSYAHIPGLRQAANFALRYLPDGQQPTIRTVSLNLEFLSDFLQDNFRSKDGDREPPPVVAVEQLPLALQTFSPRSFADECQLRPGTTCCDKVHRYQLSTNSGTMQRVTRAIVARPEMAALAQAAREAWQAECVDLTFAGTDDSLLAVTIARATLRTASINHASYVFTHLIPIQNHAS